MHVPPAQLALPHAAPPWPPHGDACPRATPQSPVVAQSAMRVHSGMRNVVGEGCQAAHCLAYAGAALGAAAPYDSPPRAILSAHAYVLRRPLPVRDQPLPGSSNQSFSSVPGPACTLTCVHQQQPPRAQQQRAGATAALCTHAEPILSGGCTRLIPIKPGASNASHSCSHVAPALPIPSAQSACACINRQHAAQSRLSATLAGSILGTANVFCTQRRQACGCVWLV